MIVLIYLLREYISQRKLIAISDYLSASEGHLVQSATTPSVRVFSIDSFIAASKQLSFHFSALRLLREQYWLWLLDVHFFRLILVLL